MKGKRRRRPGAIGLLLAAAIGLLLAAAIPLGLALITSTSTYASGAEFHVVESLACNDQSLCGSLNLSSFHGEAAFNSNGTGSGQLTALGLVQGSGAGAGAQHFEIDIADLNAQPGWFVGPDGDFFISNETDTFTGRSGNPPLTVLDAFPPYPHDLGIPAAPGHYDTTELFGFTAPPGVSFQIQVSEQPG